MRHESIFSLKRIAFQTIRPRVSPFSKLKHSGACFPGAAPKCAGRPGAAQRDKEGRRRAVRRPGVLPEGRRVRELPAVFPLTLGRAALCAASRFILFKVETLQGAPGKERRGGVPPPAQGVSVSNRSAQAFFRGTAAGRKAAANLFIFRNKARWGGVGVWGRGTPLARAATGWRPQAVPVATKEATGIDSRDEGFPSPK